MDKDSVNPISTVFLVVNGKEIELCKEQTIHYQDLPKSEWSREDVKIPADALIACAGFWAGFDSKYYVSRKDNKLVVFEGGVSEDPSEPLAYTAKREITAAELK